MVGRVVGHFFDALVFSGIRALAVEVIQAGIKEWLLDKRRVHRHRRLGEVKAGVAMMTFQLLRQKHRHAILETGRSYPAEMAGQKPSMHSTLILKGIDQGRTPVPVAGWNSWVRCSDNAN